MNAYLLASDAQLKLEKVPIWHSVSCLCTACIAADARYLSHYPQMLMWTKRPLFDE